MKNQDWNKFGGTPIFGQCSTNNVLQVVRVRDLNKSIIQIPYRDIHETLGSLLKTYRQITECNQRLVDNIPIFRNTAINNKQISQSIKIYLLLDQFNHGNIEISFLNPNYLQEHKPFDSVIRHYELNVHTTSGKKMIIKVMSTDTILSLKEKIQIQYGIKCYQQKLIYAGRPLDDDCTLGEYEISSNNILYLVLILAEGCFAKGSPVMVSEGRFANIQQLQYGMQVLSYNLEKGQLQEDQVTNVHQTLTQIMLVMELEDGSVIKSTPNHLFLTDLGEWKRFQYRHNQKNLQVGEYLKSPVGKPLQITKMETHSTLPEPFYHICIKNNHNFIIGNTIAHNMRIFVDIGQDKLPLNVQPSDTIESIKIQIKQKTNISIGKQYLVFAGKQLQNQNTLHDYNIKKQETIQLVLSESTFNCYKEVFTSKVSIKLSSSATAQIDYQQIRLISVYQTLMRIMDNPKPYYCIMFGKRILQPKDIISKIEKQKNFVKNKDFSLIVLRNTEKKQFYSKIDINLPFPKADFRVTEPIEKLMKQSKQYIIKNADKTYQKEQFYTSIHYYTCNLFCEIIDESFRNLDFTNKDTFKTKQMFFAGSLLKSLYKLKNYYGTVYRTMKNIKLSKYQREGDVFCWKSFTSTSKKKSNFNSFKKGTIFHIDSLTGKDISIFSISTNDQQVIFLPFSYFMIKKIIKMETYDQVWLSQMPSPVGFNKDIVVWVDDKPYNNRKQINQLRIANKEVIQLTNTKIAVKWAKQFNWLLNWMDIKCKVITDMVRIEDERQNYYAGIDLLEQYYNIQGYSTPILVYCGDVSKSIQNAQARNINKRRIYKITSIYSDVQKYANQ